MLPVATVQQIRDAEAAFFAAHPEIDLMARAAQAVADRAVSMLDNDVAERRILVAVGAGNNGGDGLFAAAILAELGAQVSLWPTAATVHQAGLAAAVAAGARTLDAVSALFFASDADLVIDAVLGIGGRPGLPEQVAMFAAEVADLDVPVLSVDLPSGLDADSHRVTDPHFRATETVTFIARKMCHVAQPALTACGRVALDDLGIDRPSSTIMTDTFGEVAVRWPWPGPLSDKYSRGVVGIDTGSAQYTGAALLGCAGSVFSGAGMVRFAPGDAEGGSRTEEMVRNHFPSVVIGEGRVQAWVCGSGWGESMHNKQRLARRAADGVPMVIDADALALVGQVELPDGCLLTPHAGELARLLGVQRDAVEAAPIAHARQAAAESGQSVLLKGASQYAVRPTGEVIIAVPGPAWTAQAGSGDTLAGVCGTLLAAGLSAQNAGAMAATLQAVAAYRHPGPFPPDTMVVMYPDVLAELWENYAK